MDFYNNNYFQSEEFKNLNREIFKYDIIDTIDNKFYILRNKYTFKQKLRFSKANIGTEFKGILEFFGQPVNLKLENYKQKLINFLKYNNETVKNKNAGIIIFRAFDIEKKEQFEEIQKVFKIENFLCRPWNTSIINLKDTNKDKLIKSYYTLREIKRMKKRNITIDKIDTFKDYKSYMEFFFNSYGHQNYPNKEKYYDPKAWKNLKVHHNFFIIRAENEPYAIFGVRIFNERAYWCMVGRLKKYKYSLHAYAIDFLFDYLKEKKINYLDLTGFNPNPKNNKEESIKKFKETFNAKIIYQPTFIKDNTVFIKSLRKITNKIFSTNSFADENLI